jgi:hypothetical protein
LRLVGNPTGVKFSGGWYYTIQTFTGNCVRCKGDLASRNLTVLITTERPDPENREFKHPDPLGWTWDHRGKILYALFMILMTPHDQSGGTRFKEWQQLVGSAVESAANGPDVPEEQRISFKAIFLEGEREGNDDAIDYAASSGHCSASSRRQMPTLTPPKPRSLKGENLM